MSIQNFILPYFEMAATWVTSSFFVFAWCIFTASYALKWLLNLRWESFRIKSQLKSANRYLSNYNSSQEFSKCIGECHKKFQEFSILKQPWKEYSTYLVTTQVNNDNDNDVYREQYLASSHDPSDFFNAKTVIEATVDPKLFASIPTQLCGHGVLGTFCGLSCGIFLAREGLAGGNLDEIQVGLARLLGGASLAFWTSIVGVFSSIVYGRFERSMHKGIQKHIDALNNRISNLVAPITIEGLAQQQISKQSTQIKQLGQVVERLAQIQSDRATSNDELVLKVVGEFKNTLSAATSDEVKLIASSLKQINQALASTSEAIEKSGKNITDLTENSSKFFKKNLFEISHQFQSTFTQSTEITNASVKNAAREITHALAQGAKIIQDSLNKPVATLADTLNKLQNQASKTSEAWSAATEANILHAKTVLNSHSKLSEYIVPLMETTKAISSACQESQVSLNESSQAAKEITQAVSRLELSNADIKKQWEDYSKRFASVDQSLHQIFTQTTNSLNQYSTKVKDFTTELDKHMSRGMLSLAGAIGDLNQIVQALPEASKTATRTRPEATMTRPNHL